MRVTFDPQKNAKNVADRGLSFDDLRVISLRRASKREVKAYAEED